VTNRTLKFTPDQARAILEMKLRQLTGLDESELQAEKEHLEELIVDLTDLIDNPSSRAVRCYKQMAEASKRHGNARQSQLIDPPDSLQVQRQSGGAKQPSAPKPRFMSIDMKKGVVSQAKGPRGALVVDSKEKVVLITESGYLRKVPANFKGPIAAGYSAVVLAKREVEVAERKYLVVFTLEGQLKAMVLSGADLIKANSRGKSYLPEGAELVHFGEGSYSVPWTSKRKKALTVDLTFKAGKPGGKGGKIAQIEDVTL
jgi:DNA gyrase/topoisomerase IV subunit A